MEVTGTVKVVTELQTGEGKNGTWKNRDIVIDLPGEYENILAVGFTKDAADAVGHLNIGDEITCQVNVTSREYNGKYYTQCRCWKYEVVGGATTQAQQESEDFLTSAATVTKSKKTAKEVEDSPF